MIRSFSDESNFLHKLLLTNRQISRLYKAFEKNSSAITKLSKTQLSKEGQSGEISDRLLGALLKIGLPLMENVLQSLTKSVLMPLRLTAGVSTTDVAIQKTIFGSGLITLIISNVEMDFIIKIVQSLEEPVFL